MIFFKQMDRSHSAVLPYLAGVAEWARTQSSLALSSPDAQIACHQRCRPDRPRLALPRDQLTQYLEELSILVEPTARHLQREGK